MSVDISSKIERAKVHLATCMERGDFPSHNCACNCDDVANLLAENDRLRAALEKVAALFDNMRPVGSRQIDQISEGRAACTEALGRDKCRDV